MADQIPLPHLGPRPLVVAPVVFVAFEIAGEPKAKARHRSRIGFLNRKPFVMQYPDPETAKYEKVIAQVAALAMRGRDPTDKPVALLVHAYRSVPASWSKRDREAALAGTIRPTSKPDGDNYLKAVSDAMNKIVYFDDSQVIDGRVIKRYDLRPALRIEVREFLPAE